MEEKKTILNWVKEHKKELVILGVAAVGAVIVVKNWDTTKGAFDTSEPIATPPIKVEPVAEEKVVPAISNSILENLTGHKLTATELGNRVLCSAQEINKRIVAAGLATKQPSGDYSLTEAGRLVGEHTWKTTWASYSFLILSGKKRFWRLFLVLKS